MATIDKKNEDTQPANKEAWATYRQALRDLPNAEGFPWVDFPNKPE